MWRTGSPSTGRIGKCSLDRLDDYLRELQATPPTTTVTMRPTGDTKE